MRTGGVIAVVVALVAAGAVAAGYGHRTGARAAALEAAVLAIAGGALALGWVSALLALGDGTPAAELAVGWAAFVVHGVVDTVLWPFGIQLLTRPGVLQASALVVGALAGGLHGAHRIYPWRRWGATNAAADATWGLPGTTLGVALHLVNARIGERAHDGRTGAVRFSRGVHPPGKGYAVTLGPTLSNCRRGPGSPLFEHEVTHVRQSRCAGPLYTLTYVGWMAVVLPVAVVVGLVRRAPASRIEPWCYASNPWEVFAYGVQRRCLADPAATDPRVRVSGGRCLSEPVAKALGVPFLVGAGAVLALLGAGAMT